MIGPKLFTVIKPRPSMSQRLPERKCMTIAAGFVCHNGIVLCADSQESYGDLKWPVKKLVYPRSCIHPIMIAGAGFGPAIDTATQKIFDRTAMTGASCEQVLRFTEEILREMHEKDLPHHPVAQAGGDVSFELLIAFNTPESGSRLYKSSGSLIKRVEQFEIIGSGSIINYFAHSLYRRTSFDSPIASVSEGIVLAAYLIYLAKSQLSSIGGRSQIMMLGTDGHVNYASDWEVPRWERAFSEYQWLSGNIMLDCADPNSSQHDFDLRLDTFTEAVKAIKADLLKQRQEWDAIFEEVTMATNKKKMQVTP